MSGVRARLREFAYRHVGGSVAVLVYHRVADLERDPQLLAVPAERFAAQMEALASRYPIVPLSEVAAGIESRRLPRRAVAVTFDDGYADNLHTAAPILARAGVPATVFVSSGYASARREYWWDEVERLVLEPGTLPESIEIEAAGSRFSGSPEDLVTYGETAAARHASWDITLAPPSARHRLYLELSAFLRGLDPLVRDEALAQLREMADTGLRSPRASHLPLSEAEVTVLGQAPGMEIGGHTANHARLSGLAEDRQRAEIEDDRSRLGELLGREPALFAYPYGGFDDYNDTSARIVAEAGYSLACANFPRPAKPWSDPHRLPRFLVRDWDGDTLVRRVEGWLANGGGEAS